jgi:hypothetical protein
MSGEWLNLGGFQNLILMRVLERDMEISIGFQNDGSSTISMIQNDHEKV